MKTLLSPLSTLNPAQRAAVSAHIAEEAAKLLNRATWVRDHAFHLVNNGNTPDFSLGVAKAIYDGSLES